MIKKVLIIIKIVFIANIFAQTPAWFWSNPLPQGNTLNSVSFLNQNKGFIVGNYGTLLKTTNGGSNWEYLQPYLPKNLNSMYFVNSNIGFAVGDSGLIVKTTNGGDSWIILNSGVDTTLTDIFFLNENYGYAVGYWGLVLKTTNGGFSWNSQSFYYNNNKVLMLDSSNGFIPHDFGMLRTTNGGASWHSVSLNPNITLKDIKFINNQVGIVVGGNFTQGHILKTTDGGNTWTTIVNNSPWGFTGLFFHDSVTGFATGYSGTLLKTTDGGNNWTDISLNTYKNLLKGTFFDSDNGIIIGEGGLIYKTTDGGNSWNKITVGTDQFIYSSYFLNNSFGMAAGGGGVILKTTNGGINWSEKNVDFSSNITIYDVHIFDNNNAYAVSLSGHHYRTSDGGETWSYYGGLNANTLLRLIFVNDSVGYAVGYWGTVIKTTSSGITWNFANSGISNSIILFDADFLDASKGFVCGSNGTILKTTDGGSSWSNLNSGTTAWIRGIDFWDDNLGLAVGDNYLILKTTNGGVSWDSISGIQWAYSYHSVKFVTPQYAVVTGDLGKILISSDGGNSWSEQISSTNNNLFRVTVVDTATYFVVGASGTILKTINAGIPVELENFTAFVNGNTVTLSWTTATELNNSGFDIERKQLFSSQSSIGDNYWEKISFIQGNGTTTEKHSYSFQDKNLSSGKYQYRLKQIDFDGTFQYSNVTEIEIGVPEKFSLEQNYPNPFNPSTKIRYSIPNVGSELAQTVLKVYDILGNEVATLVNEKKPAGIYEVEFNASQLSSGIYFYKLSAGPFTEIKKMTLIK
ncbi:YCF48-related protein [Ignavibacterium album]|uniref:YCF48-related protein n=2 Tax=Ignavibacterium album TaxID=591197 RepID=UPI0026E9EACA|nr:YCF48-related protein [Ignavibacterium album]